MHRPPTDSTLLQQIDQSLRSEGPSPGNLQAVLDQVLVHFGGNVNTIHRWDAASGVLRLAAHHGLPEAMLPKVAAIPLGKGMAGLAAERRQAVQVCNLQTDCSGTAQPGAKATGAQGSIAVPMLVGGELRGVLGVAKADEHDFDEKQIGLLEAIAGRIGEAFTPDAGAVPQ
jgi:putative methionine-R-sulfoxide reductase with GAF domain